MAQDVIQFESASRQLICRGEWDLANLVSLQAAIQQLSLPDTGTLTINGQAITKMDSAGAWLLISWCEGLKQRQLIPAFAQFSAEHQSLLAIVQKRLEEEAPIPAQSVPGTLAWLGMTAYQQFKEMKDYLAFVGLLTYEAIRLVRHPRQIRWSAVASVIYRTGYQALPIIALLSVMIGVVITYQMGLQLRNYGANIFIVDLLGLSILREFGPLITAIMVAGRTGSAFTAQLGMMKINQEIDALDTMGVTPSALLLLPRIAGLFIALPLVTMWADIFGVIGGMFMSNNMLNITWYDFLHRFPTVIPLRALFIGLGKAPIFALIISSIGCYQGVNVEMNADSVGRNTTKSVVLSIFFIIVADAIFSVIFSKLKL